MYFYATALIITALSKTVGVYRPTCHKTMFCDIAMSQTDCIGAHLSNQYIPLLFGVHMCVFVSMFVSVSVALSLCLCPSLYILMTMANSIASALNIIPFSRMGADCITSGHVY